MARQREVEDALLTQLRPLTLLTRVSVNSNSSKKDGSH
jgi:hypothetical protein